MVDTSQLTELISALRAETAADSVSPDRVGYVMERILDAIDTLSDVKANAIKGYKAITSTAQLPYDPTPDEQQLAYVLGCTIYVYTGDYGDTLGGTWQSVNLRGPKGDKGDSGVTLGQVALVDDLTTGGSEDALTAEQGKVLKGLIDDVDALLEPLVEEQAETLTRASQTNGYLVNTNTAKVQNGGNAAYAMDLYAVTPGDVLQLEFAADNTAAVYGSFDAFGLGFFTSAPANTDSALALVEVGASPLKLKDSAAASPLRVTVPAGATCLAATVWKSVTGSVVVKKVTESIDIHSEEAAEALALATEATDTLDNITTITPKVVGKEGSANGVHINIGTSKFAGGNIMTDYYAVNAGDRLTVKWSGTSYGGGDLIGALAWCAAVPAAGDSCSPISGTSGAYKLNAMCGQTVEVTVSQSGYLAVGVTASLSASVERSERLVRQEKIAPDTLEWSVPSTLYAIVGEEKRVYIDCILKDFGSYVVSMHGVASNVMPTSGTQGTNCVACITGGYLYFCAQSAGDTYVTLDVYDRHGTFVGSKTLHFVAIQKSLPTTKKRVCIIGDSITEIYNMAWYIENKFKDLFSDSPYLPQFVGSKRGTYISPSHTAERPTCHEAWYGEDYQFLCTSNNSRFVNGGSLDIAHWRTADTFASSTDRQADGCGLQPGEKVDVVSLAMGSNGTPDAAGRDSELSYLKQLIAAFKADNANTIFIVHLNTLLGRGEGADPWMGKLLTRYEWREALLEDADLANDPNIIIGDLGCCYDRFWAYRVEMVHPLGDYDSFSVPRIRFDKTKGVGFAFNDNQHPSDVGERQLGESIVPVLLAAMQR